MILEKPKHRDAIHVIHFNTTNFSFQICPFHHIDNMTSKLLMLSDPTVGD